MAHAKADFDDKRVAFQEWPALKSSGVLPAGQIPVWVENDVYFNQSKAILRKLARKYGYEPADPLVAWRVDSVIDEAPDHFEKFYGVISQKKFEDDSMLEKYLEVVKGLTTFVERVLTSNGRSYIASDKITAADFAVAGVVFAYIFNEAFAGGEKWATAGQALVLASPRVSAWV